MDRVVKGLTATKKRLKFAFANVQECFDMMSEGTEMLKVRPGKKTQYKRTYYLDVERGRIRWEPSSKTVDKSRILVDSITEVREGHQSDVFRQSRGLYNPARCLSIVYGSQYEQLDLVAPTELKASQWIVGLRSLVRKSAGGDKLQKRQSARDLWLKGTFEAADKNGDGTLSLDEVLKLMHKLNVGLGSSQVRRLFEASDTDTDGESANALDFDEFQNFYKTVSTRSELYYLLMRYSSSEDEHLTMTDLQEFLQTEQMMSVSWGDCEEIIKKYEPTSAGQRDKWLGIDGFTQYLVGPEGDIFNPELEPIYQDMRQPLSHYFINASHNTYLTADQVTSKSSVDMYIKALKLGCRCVEIDCWDGSDDEPVVYHGYTLTSKIKFYEVITAINKYAFVTSQYPLILSIENHCSVDQQKKMAEYMQKVFKEKLLMEKIDPNMQHLPSPEQLKGKILVKNQKLEDEEAEEGWVIVEDEADEMDAEHKQESDRVSSEPRENAGSGPYILVEPPVRETRSVSPRPRPIQSVSLPSGRSRNYSYVEQSSSLSLKTPLRDKGRSKSFGVVEDELHDVIDLEPKRKAKLARALSQLVVYTKSVRFRGFCDNQTDIKWWEMSSLCENEAQKCCIERRAHRFVHHNRRQLSRIYPAGYRIDSSNFNPQDMWNCGCQIVALNYQKEGKMMQLNRARFRVNGNCGYVLKPGPMRDEQHLFNPYSKGCVHNVAPILLSVKIISGQQFPKPKGVEKGEIIDPYVKIEIIGLPNDHAEESTKVIDNNGFDPIWNETFTFNIIMPELALIRFVVMDKDVVSDDYIGQATFPVNSLREGYRHISLEGEGIEVSTLFVHVTKGLSVQFENENENQSFLDRILRMFRKSESPAANEVATQRQGDVLLLRQRQIGSMWVHQRTPAVPHCPVSSSSNSLPVCDIAEEEDDQVEGEADGDDESVTHQTSSGDVLLHLMQNGRSHKVDRMIDTVVQESFDSVFSAEREVSPSFVDVQLQGNHSNNSTREVSPAAVELNMK